MAVGSKKKRERDFQVTFQASQTSLSVYIRTKNHRENAIEKNKHYTSGGGGGGFSLCCHWDTWYGRQSGERCGIPAVESSVNL